MKHRVTRCALTSLVVFCLAVSVRAGGPGGDVVQGPPPGWELVRITHDAEFDEHVAMNNVGQIVFAKQMPDGTHEEIFLYDSGKLRRLTFNLFQDQAPRVNDNGTIVWYRQPDGPDDATEVYRWRGGVIEQLTNNSIDDFRPDITNTELIMWSRQLEGETAQLVQYRDGVLTQVTDNGWSNACVRINEDEDFSWVGFDFDAEPSWRSTIMSSIMGEIHELTDGTTQAQGCTINNQGVVGWNEPEGIMLWENGNTTVLPNTENGSAGPMLNNIIGEILYAHWVGEYWSPFLVRSSVTYQITNSEELGMSDGDINDRRNVLLILGGFPETDVWLMWRIRDPGDFTGDAVIDVFDFESMLNCMSNAECGTQTPPVCFHVFDLDGDGDLDLHDFGLFQRLVTPNP